MLWKRTVGEKASRSPQRQRQRQKVEPRASALPPRVPMVNLHVPQTYGFAARQDDSSTSGDTCSDPVRTREIRRSCVTPQD